jgi:hypothetical protein
MPNSRTSSLKSASNMCVWFFYTFWSTLTPHYWKIILLSSLHKFGSNMASLCSLFILDLFRTKPLGTLEDSAASYTNSSFGIHFSKLI